jgi:two-component system, NtrC family, nitrogen regulation sensor histidine kinase NtrY
MVFNDFRFRVAYRVVLLGLVMSWFVYSLTQPNLILAAAITGAIIVLQLTEIFRFISSTNRKLTRFLESIKYSDFVSGFAHDNKLGQSFRELNAAFNEVLEAFRKARSEKEENWQYLNTVVQQVRTGILSFDSEGTVQLINTNAKKFTGVNTLKNISELRDKDPKLYEAVCGTLPGKSALYKAGNEFLLTIQTSELKIRGNTITLVTLQNIQTELQKQELEAWQNLTRVLRHEIMNSITPISSLTSTLREVLDHDLTRKENHFELNNESAEDLREGLGTIENRSKGLIKFIDAYREYTSLPQPKFKPVALKELIERVAQLMRVELKNTGIEFQYRCDPGCPEIEADEEMIEQVLINLIKNSIEALSQTTGGKIDLNVTYVDSTVAIDVIDNGTGIIPEAIERVFIPFFTTKKAGSGIGLALSRQIMQLHNGTLTVKSEPYIKTTFRLKF